MAGYVRLIHWNDEEARERASLLQSHGYRVVHDRLQGATTLSRLRANPPIAFVIDLSRLPSHGREVAMALRQYSTLRQIPIVFVEGDPVKLKKIRSLLPDATYSTWRGIRPSLRKALTRPLTNPVVPESGLAAYSDTPLMKKLGIGPGMSVRVITPPRGYTRILAPLPEGASLRTTASSAHKLTIWFVRSLAQLEHRMERVARELDTGMLWIAWPKKTSGVKTDVTQPEVRRVGLAARLVDFKICAIDHTWSALKFTRRKSEA